MILTQSLLEEVQRFVLRNELTQVGRLAQEPAFKTQNALSRVVSLVVRSLLDLSERVSGREVVWSMAHDAAQSEVLSNPRQVLYAGNTISDRGATLVRSLLGTHYEASLQEIATSTGVQPAAVTELVNLVVPLVLGMIGEQIAEHQWSAKALSQWLHSQQRPPLPPPTLITPTMAAGSTRRPVTTSRWLWIALVVAACIIGYLLGYQPSPEPTVVYQQVASVATSTVPAGPWDAENPAALLANGQYTKANGSYIYDRAGVPVVLKLKGGVRQIIGANSTENKLYQVLATPARNVAAVDRRTEWITFDRIYFESNKATLTAESMWQLSNVASILLTFPRSKVLLGGYTDSTGSVLSNIRLSQARAQAAKATLIKFGVDSTHLETIGYGARNKIASNTSVDGRALNRRVSIHVVQR